MATTGAHACMRPDFERVRLQLLYCFPVQAILAPSILIRCVPQQGQYGCSVRGLGGSAQRPRQQSMGGRQLRTIYGADFGLQQRTRRGDSGSPCARPALVAGAPLRERGGNCSLRAATPSHGRWICSSVQRALRPYLADELHDGRTAGRS